MIRHDYKKCFCAIGSLLLLLGISFVQAQAESPRGERDSKNEIGRSISASSNATLPDPAENIPVSAEALRPSFPVRNKFGPVLWFMCGAACAFVIMYVTQKTFRRSIERK